MQVITASKPTTVIDSTIKFGCIVVGSLFFNLLFWKEKIAINSIFFLVFICAGILYFYPKAHINKKVRWLFMASLFSLTMVILHNTLLSKIALVLALFLMAGYSQYVQNSLLYAGASILQSIIYFIPAFFASIKQLFSFKHKKFGFGRKIRLFILPFIIVAIFFIVYLMANKVFANVAERVAEKINWVFAHLLNWIEPQRLLFLILGLVICGGLLVRYIKAPLEAAESVKIDELERVRKSRTDKGFMAELALIFTGKYSNGTLALKYEYKSGVICLILLNALLLLVNTTDIVYVWFGFNYSHDMNLTKFVHEGAELLVVSILLAMLIVLFFFRGNLNFLEKNKKLKLLAYAWIAQNAILAFSVCVRNVYYIQYTGLAYKRVGLFFFILLVLIGLLSIVHKISNKKSSYYLWRVNAMAAFTVLVLSSCIDWDMTIAKYNISAYRNSNKTFFDADFLLQMNDHVLPLLEQNKTLICKVFPTAKSENNYTTDNNRIDNCTLLQTRITSFLQSEKEYSWLSWNWADENAVRGLVK